MVPSSSQALLNFFPRLLSASTSPTTHPPANITRMWKSEDTSYDGAPNCPVIALLRDSSHVETVNDSPHIERMDTSSTTSKSISNSFTKTFTVSYVPCYPHWPGLCQFFPPYCDLLDIFLGIRLFQGRVLRSIEICSFRPLPSQLATKVSIESRFLKIDPTLPIYTFSKNVIKDLK